MQSILELKEHELKKWSLADFQESEKVVKWVPNNRKIWIICGCGRSGTTLTRVILDSHSQIYAWLESLLFLPIPIIASTLAKKFDFPLDQITSKLSSCSNKSDFIEWFISAVLRKNDKALFVDKTARNIHVLEDIWKVYPNALVVHLVRDPVDTVSSLQTHPKKMIDDGAVIETGIEHNLNDCINRWKLATWEALKHKWNPNFHIVQYEDLVLNTEKTVKEVCDFLWISFETKMLDFTSQNWKHTREPLRWFVQNIKATKPLSTDAIWKGYQNLKDWDIAKIRQETWRMYEWLTYTTPSILSNNLVTQILQDNPLVIKEGVLDSLRLHHQKSLVQPPKVYLQREWAHTADRIISMPVYAFWDVQSAGMKWIGSHPENHQVGLQRANAVICLNHFLTNAPIAILDGTEISSERTFWMGILGIENFAPNPQYISIIGMGKLWKMFASRLRTFFPSIQSIRCYSESWKHIYNACLDGEVIVWCDTWKETLKDADVVITTTAKGEPYIQNADLSPTVKCMVNLSLMDFDIDVFENSQVVVDDFGQCSRAKKVFKRWLDQWRIQEESVVEFGNVLFWWANIDKDRKVLFNPLGMWIEDLCCAKRIYDIALRWHRDQVLHL